MKQKIGILIDYDFTNKHVPPYPHPVFFSYENPKRMQTIIQYLEGMKLFENEKIHKLIPRVVTKSILQLAHSQYYIEAVERLSKFGSGMLSEETYITHDTFLLAKKAVGGVIACLESVINHKSNQAFALVRPPGHHALREQSSGLCIFNNIANAIHYLRKRKNYNKKIVIIDIDDHYGDGIARFFYEDPNVLYFSVHEFDFVEGDMGFITELGAKKGKGTNINFPIPMNTTDAHFMEFTEILTPILAQFHPDLIIVAAGFDMYFADPIGNCLLTSKSYYEFAKYILARARQVCDGKVAFVLEGGYSLIGLPICVSAIIRALLGEPFIPQPFEQVEFSAPLEKTDFLTIKDSLKELLQSFWNI
ncbi:MAG: Histone deacetylase-like amidohydrolase [Promethearchaeota archaeon]|nr:MAG: Histone deacetylase-like amidohydrolase [Candidatus Lokiarchaeota archaeon]